MIVKERPGRKKLDQDFLMDHFFFFFLAQCLWVDRWHITGSYRQSMKNVFCRAKKTESSRSDSLLQCNGVSVCSAARRDQPGSFSWSINCPLICMQGGYFQMTAAEVKIIACEFYLRYQVNPLQLKISMLNVGIV